MNAKPRFLQRLSSEVACLVTISATRGSVPREAGAWMAVLADTTVGTIGGGHLEHDAIRHARDILTRGGGDEVLPYPLGPRLGQCCGGEVLLRYEYVTAPDIPTLTARLTEPIQVVALFGGGHVGRALVQVLGNLPFAVRWVDSRDEIFPAQLPDNVQCEHSDPVHAAVADLVPQSRVLIMSFSHAEDLDIVAACLARQRAQGDLPYVGLIGSKTKWASFRQQLEARGFFADEIAHVTSPIGVPGIADKRPEVIAVGVAAQLLQMVKS
ncbi:MAG: xanthine dehydrogenase accessory protein XdhC [Burkholderiales bacterium]|nr:xanthine dehydrogenase accessory protein XdhC [Burkholderiales bacterium]